MGGQGELCTQDGSRAGKIRDMGELQKQLTRTSRAVQDRFEAEKRVLSFDEFLSEVEGHPQRYSRDAARYMRDCFDHFDDEGKVNFPGENFPREMFKEFAEEWV